MADPRDAYEALLLKLIADSPKITRDQIHDVIMFRTLMSNVPDTNLESLLRSLDNTLARLIDSGSIVKSCSSKKGAEIETYRFSAKL